MSKPVVLIMAGGKGERFWPRSRESRPKQLQKVYSNKTLLQETWDRARSFTSPDRIFVGCNQALKKSILVSHPFIPEGNFVVEPEGKNTAPIVALAALQLEDRFPGSVQVVLSADHFISPVKDFAAVIKAAVKTAQSGYLVTLGVEPTRPETGYGYIQAGDWMEGKTARLIKSFREKPDQKTASGYIKKENYFWNSGIFIWKGDVIIQEFAEHAPEIFEPIAKSHKKPGQLKKVFAGMKGEPVDIAILEKSKKLAMIPAGFRWDDVGSWLSLDRIVEGDSDSNIFLADSKKGKLSGVDASGNIVVSSKELVALLGVKDLILVEEEDLIFVADRNSIGGIKDMIGKFKENPSLQKYLK